MTIDAGGNVLVTMAVEIGRLRTVKSDPNGAVVWTREHSMEGGWMSYPMAIGVGSDLSVAVVGIAAGDSTSIA